MRDPRCKNDEETIARSLNGNYRPEHLFSLKQAVDLYTFYQNQVAECDQRILDNLASFDAALSIEDTPGPGGKRSTPLGKALLRMAGVDLTRIDGIDTNTALKIIAEIGTDMNRWKSAKEFASWLGLCPGMKVSGDKVLSGKTKQVANRAEHAARIAGVLALVEDLHRRSIPKRSMEAGIALCEFYLTEALRLFEAGACDPDLVLAEKLLSWALAQGEYIHLAQVYQFGPNALRDAKTARRIAGILQDHGWLRSAEGKEIDGMKRREAWQVVQTPRETGPTAKPANTANAEPLFSTISDISSGEDANHESGRGSAAFPEHDVPVEEPAKNDAPATHYRPEVVL